MKAITESGVPKMSSARVAPIMADGSVERMVIGWMVFSYRMPSTM